jgi:hypothetical protein
LNNRPSALVSPSKAFMLLNAKFLDWFVHHLIGEYRFEILLPVLSSDLSILPLLKDIRSLGYYFINDYKGFTDVLAGIVAFASTRRISAKYEAVGSALFMTMFYEGKLLIAFDVNNAIYGNTVNDPFNVLVTSQIIKLLPEFAGELGTLPFKNFPFDRTKLYHLISFLCYALI